MEQVNPQKMTPEQVEALKEKLKNMSPEELREFQKKQCIFCQIVQGKVQAKKIYEDKETLAILDINPSNPGHILLLPKEHYTVMPQLSDDEIAHIFMVAKSLSNTILRVLEARGTNILVANGPAAGQKAQHFMVHIIPRKENDNLEFTLPQKQIPEKELDLVRDRLVEKIGKKPKAEEKKFDLASLQTPKVVEGEFTEEKKEAELPETSDQEPTKKIKKKGSKPKKGPKKRKKSAKEKDISLDDISRMLGA